MLVSVTERTREIGLRKAVGARRRDIMLQFLIEAVSLSLLGGALGIGVGYGLSALASLHPRMVNVVIPWWAVALGFGIATGTGVVFGLVPAVKAALLNPIDALRHE
jgi:putative ABC transport system permease protein